MSQTKFSGSWAKVILLVVGVAVSVAVINLLKNNTLSEFKKIKQDVEKSNKTLPTMMDESTRLDKINITNKNHLTYEFTIVSVNSTTPEAVIDNLKTQIIPNIQPRMLQDPSVMTFLSKGITISYLYRNNDGTKMGTISATPEQYTANKPKSAAPSRK